MNKCSNCGVFIRAMASTEPACCAGYMDNVVCGDKSLEDCDVCESVKPNDCEV